MRYVNIIIVLLMLLFMAVQHNDPDGPLWMIIYSVPAIWAAIAAYDYKLLWRQPAHWLLPLCIACAALATIYFWPRMAEWWKPGVWLEELSGETAREGMGMMIVTIALAVTWFSCRRKSDIQHS